MSPEIAQVSSQSQPARRSRPRPRPNAFSKAEKQDGKLERRIQRLKERGQHHKAEQLTRFRARSFSLRLTGVARASSKLGTEPRAGLASIGLVRVAEQINLARPSNETVRLKAPAKRDGNLRYIMSFGLEGKARQEAIIRLLRPLKSLHEGQRAVVGGGQAVTGRKVVEALEQGYRWAVLVDIRNFFGSYNAEVIPDLLSLEQAVTRSNILSTHLQLVPTRPRATQRTDDQIDPSGHRGATRSQRRTLHTQREFALSLSGIWACRRGLPQGSAASPMVSEMLLAPMFAELPAGVEVMTHLDDILVFCRTKRKADLSLQALRAALEQHPAGPLALKRAEIRRAYDGFDFLGYRFRRRNGEPIAQPTERNRRRFRAGMIAHILATALKGEGADKARNFVRSWCGQFKLWPAAATWKALHLRDIDQAERMGEFIHAGGLDPAGRATRIRAIFGIGSNCDRSHRT